MAVFETLKAAVQQAIKQNGNEEITGNVLQTVLLSIINNVGANATYVGIATPSTNPGTPDGAVFYIASVAGTYTNFLNSSSQPLVLTQGINILKFNGTAWSVEQVWGVDDEPIAGSDNLVKSGGISKFIGKSSVIQEDLECNIIKDYYINSDGTWRNLGEQSVRYYPISEGERIMVKRGNSIVYSVAAFFTSTPEPNITPYSVIANSENLDEYVYITSPINGYVAISSHFQASIKLYRVGDSIKQYTEIWNAIHENEYVFEEDAILIPIAQWNNFYVATSGYVKAQTGQYNLVYKVKKNDAIRMIGYGANWASIAYFSTIPTDATVSPVRVNSTPNMTFDISPIDGYVVVNTGIGILQKGILKTTKGVEENIKALTFNSAEDSQFKSIPNYYINADGSWRNLSGQSVVYWSVNEGEEIILKNYTNTPYANAVFFSHEPNAGDAFVYSITGHTEELLRINVSADGYIACSFAYTGTTRPKLFRNIDKNKKLLNIDSITDKIDNSILERKLLTGIIENYFITNVGTWKNQNGQYTKIYKVSAGEVLICNSTYGNEFLYSSFAYFADYPTTSSTPIYSEQKQGISISPIDGYVAIPSPLDKYDSLLYSTRKTYEYINSIASIIDDFDIQSDTAYGLIENYYINADGSWRNLSSQQVYIWPVSVGEKIKVKSGIYYNPNYIGYALFSNFPNVGDTPDKTGNILDDEAVITIDSDGYIAMCGIAFYGAVPSLYRYVGVTKKLEKMIDAINASSSSYADKTCLYIGDSISTGNNYHWKGYIEDLYKLRYVRDNNSLRAAEGGLTIVPPITEPDEDSRKSIWYRCAANRMAQYDFDIISLFGGTNDMSSQELIIGTVDDIAYVDDATGFDSSIATDVRPQELSFASALKGCILMLKRDFPTKEIIIPTVMPCGGSYGNWTDTDTGLKASEAIANLQLRIAEMYNLKAIPLYWDMRTSENAAYNWADQYGVHPNHQGARRIMSLFVQTLAL